MSGRCIAIVEDDPDVGDLLKKILAEEGYSVSLYPTPGRFFDALLRRRPDLVVLDMHLPGMDGKEVLRVLRANAETRGLFVVAISGEQRATRDIVNGITAGADEYMVKPLDLDLFCVRIEALFQRGRPAGPVSETVRLGELAMIPEERRCTLKGKPLRLTRLEFDLLLHFVRQRNRVLMRGALLEAVWKGDPSMTTRTVDKHVEMLRRKLGSFGKRLETVIRVGYVLKA